MKKTLFYIFTAGVLGFTTLQANEKSGVFIGADLGVALNVSHEEVATVLPGYSASASSTGISFNWLYGAKLGYQQYFGNYNGLRLYGHFNYLHFGKDPMMKYGVNLDYLLNFSDGDSPWGLFIGAGYEWMAGDSKEILDKREPLENEKIHTHGFLVNVGFSKIYSNHHRLEFGAKIPLYSYDELDSESIKIHKRTYANLYIGYSYSF